MKFTYVFGVGGGWRGAARFTPYVSDQYIFVSQPEVLHLDILDTVFLHTDSSALDVLHPNILNPDVFTRHGSHIDLLLSYISHLDFSDQHVLQLVISDPAILHRDIAYKDVSQLVIFPRCFEANSEPALF